MKTNVKPILNKNKGKCSS